VSLAKYGIAGRTSISRHWAPLLIVLAINSIVLANALIHRPTIGYNMAGHLLNMGIYPYRFPTPEDSGEFFSAPLSYLLPSLLDKLCVANLPTDTAGAASCRDLDGRAGQLINVMLSIGITILLWKICERLRPGSDSFKTSTFSLLGILTVYYRTFSQARPEPYVAFFTCWVCLEVLEMLHARGFSWRRATRLGVLVGLLLLSRQWAFLGLPAFAVLLWGSWRRSPAHGRHALQAVAAAGAVAALVAGWFYAHLYLTQGRITAFNREPAAFSISNQSAKFYFGVGLEDLRLLREPLRGSFDGQLLPVFYSDVWGDYWCKFSCVDEPGVEGAAPNRDAIGRYLGRVNAVSLYPTLLLLAGLCYGAVCFWRSHRVQHREPSGIFVGYLVALIVCSWCGFLVFLVSFPAVEMGTKATYVIQVFMALPLLGALLLEKLRTMAVSLYALSLIGLGLVFAHNVPALFTRYPWRP
jgi:hypothetical protein